MKTEMIFIPAFPAEPRQALGLLSSITLSSWRVNEKTLHADLLLAGITQLITVVLADRIHKHEYIRSLKPLIA